ncbi:MAG: hypothetical protein NZ989_06140 [Bacteroidia bacterium]|nr:hypothetical protein [Bacteroidia bacterium]MDW8057862.1 hypothetical protein [Bacteroidia bacterium]
MRLLIVGFLLALHAQGHLKVGRKLSESGEVIGADTVFHLQGTSLSLWVEARIPLNHTSDTLWIIARSIGKPAAVYFLYRVKAQNSLYRGRMAFRSGGIYLLSVVSPNQPRLTLARKRIYITDAHSPTVADLRARLPHQPHLESSSIEAPSLEELDTASENLLEKGHTPPPIDEELEIEDNLDISIEPPEESEEEFELDDIDVDLEDL